MKTFKEFCESEAPSSVDANVGKPGGQTKGKPDFIKQVYKKLGDRLEAIDTEARKRREAGEKTPFQELFQKASDEIRDILKK